jgi:L-alanine-DL-glutamate epimerase-like enolase superfamily enzyme
MKITAVETMYLPHGVTVHAGPIQWLWVRIHTDSGLVGLGETYPWPEAEAAVVRRALAPVLLGRDAREIERLWADMFLAISYSGWAGAEIRAISAIDMALWDLAGKAAGVPVYQLLGGKSRETIRTYNTCYDHIDFMTQPVKLARSLLDSGIRAMKIWPLDDVARETRGQHITAAQMRSGLEPLRRIKQEFGDEMDVAMEFHGFWNLPCAVRIAQACEEYGPMWLEEMLPQDNLAAYAELAAETSLPLCVSERLMTRWGFRELMENGAAQIIMPDISWCGGITEAKKIASAAETMLRPVAPHNCGGPALHAASLHLAANLTNLFILETVRRRYAEEFRGIVNNTYEAVDGAMPVPDGPGLGVELTNETLMHPGAKIDRFN